MEEQMLKKLVIGLLVLIFSTPLAYAAKVGGVNIQDTINTDAGSLVLNGTGIRKKFGFKVYVGALYLKEKTTDSQKIIDADEPMAIEMTWKRTGPVNKVKPVYEEGFKYDVGKNYDALKPAMDKFLAAVVKGKKGDVWTYRYLPGKGLEFLINGELVETFPGIDFKKAVFAIWLHEGENFTGDKKLKAGMLGK